MYIIEINKLHVSKKNEKTELHKKNRKCYGCQIKI